MSFTAKDVKALRDRTNAGMMDCKKALEETDGDSDAAVELLRKKGIAQSAKRAGRVAAEGAIFTYIHPGAKYGVLVEINCETDFAARSDPFQELGKEICMQVCSAAPGWVRREDIPEEEREAEKAIYVARAKDTGKPEHILEKIAEGMLRKWYKEVCLVEQGWVKDPDKTIEELLKALSGQIGEKVDVRRFVRYELGEGIEKPKSDIAEEVAKELAKSQEG